jgi:predicted glycoside hydrolase/deacetylase ChbG (UPF0249 family)
MCQLTESVYELLGFAPNARLLIISADDFGMSHSVNEGVIHSIQEGIAVSCSLMAPCPWCLDGIQLLKQHSDTP